MFATESDPNPSGQDPAPREAAGNEPGVPRRLLFVWTMNQWRSPTAERVYGRRPQFVTRSAGTSAKARRAVSRGDIEWADLILVMEHKHARRLREMFRAELRTTSLVGLGIKDRYRFMDPALVAELHAAVDPILDADR